MTLSRWPRLLYRSYQLVNWGHKGTNPRQRSKRVGEVGHGAMVYLTCAIFGLGKRDEIIHRLKRQRSSPL